MATTFSNDSSASVGGPYRLNDFFRDSGSSRRYSHDTSSVVFPSIDTIQTIPGVKARPLRICIATEDIVGPIRNGGIGTTYTHLSFLLADAGHDVTIIYPRGKHSETNTIEYWVDWYRQRGVRFVPLDLPTDVETSAKRWLRPMLALYDALKAERFDMVHVSEWRGLAYLCLLAKKQGLDFQDTLFCMKSSSPYLWNREYMLEPIEDAGQLPKIYAERRSIELADMVIGGSRHLLVWMLKHGYSLPEQRTFVQPNVAVFADIDPALLISRPKAGTRVPINEIVFFGRLEGRKGLDVFCDAIDNLRSQGVKLPKVTFLGKFGARIARYPDLSISEYIRSKASSWDVDWNIIDGFQQADAINYLLGEGRLAVMPSVIENSSLTVYEATHFAIPFVASNRGGNPELVADEHCDSVLTDVHPVALSDKLRETIERGGLVAAPSFNNDDNLDCWRDFHDRMSTVIDHAKSPQHVCANANASTNQLVEQLHRGRKQCKASSISVCIVLRDDHVAIQALLESLIPQRSDLSELILINDGSDDPATLRWIEDKTAEFEEYGWSLLNRAHYGTPDARNYCASKAASDYLLFLEAGAKLKPGALETFGRAAAHSDADLLVPFHAVPVDANGSTLRRVVSLKGDPCAPFFDPEMIAPAILVNRRAFESLGGFSTDYKVAGDIAEYLAAATITGQTVETLPEALVIAAPEGRADRDLNHRAALMRAVRPYIDATPLSFQPLLLAAGALQKRNEGLASSPGAEKGGVRTVVRRGAAFLRYRLGLARNELKCPGAGFFGRIVRATSVAISPPRTS